MPALKPGDTVLVTGGSGFVGRALCVLLRDRGLRVRVLVRRAARGPWHELVLADLGDAAAPETVFEGVAAVFHLAGHAHALAERAGDDELYERINVEGTRSVVDAALRARCSALVLASTVKAMGEGAATPQDERDEPRPQTPYGRSKLAAERLVLAAGEDMHVAVLRLPLVYGPGAGGNLARMLRALRRRRMPGLSLPDNARSMVDVRDAASAFLLCAEDERARGEVFLLSDGEDYSTARVLSAMRAAMGLPAPRLTLPWTLLRVLASAGDGAGRLLGRRMPFDSGALRALAGSALYDSRRIRERLGFRSAWTLERALPDMCRDA